MANMLRRKNIIITYIKEYDPGTNADEYVTYHKLSPTSGTNSTVCKSIDIRSFEDGSNGQAEIYVQTLNMNAVFAIYD